ncbi:hypothetical protein PENSOL_c040G03340 [Penicillium solitum]|uniref:Uncharacterized protein n=1 Tax=Penicillium solitum TaxID=60172 RepID=A0A1V6QUA9_9EURO|nr:uncharacterized protein PENSOL_c040G03340 [Penicillium solitum]OQD92506.1 hypothetical protein PENSOL_c040G03340 [Penicillium solitum]
MAHIACTVDIPRCILFHRRKCLCSIFRRRTEPHLKPYGSSSRRRINYIITPQTPLTHTETLSTRSWLPYPADWSLESRRPLKKVSKDFARHAGKLPANILSGFPSSPDPHEEPFRRAASPSTALAEGTAPKSPHTVGCWYCAVDFPSRDFPLRNKLHAYVRQHHTDEDTVRTTSPSVRTMTEATTSQSQNPTVNTQERHPAKFTRPGDTSRLSSD